MSGKDEHINVTLNYQNGQLPAVDLRIPIKISIHQLIKEVNKIFGVENMTHKYQIKVKNKGILLDENQILKNYPVTNGDIIEILEEATHDKD
ncbi:secretion accessory protein EsaB/YukD [Vagococcus sp. BWB3-3]|uniref:Secretion accessory protein EsaB/YukD n=1 Tax=Vagococcus allomyrinae TaxID=2794353 RepID=A0A940PGC1_9ENTE|nr:EsaB/YukD family protein [Vagococcus allomyrinae]MBP1043041.1 secretion accessory protein EsaB/YukD [Vagococcus allomyrinae]